MAMHLNFKVSCSEVYEKVDFVCGVCREGSSLQNPFLIYHMWEVNIENLYALYAAV